MQHQPLRPPTTPDDDGTEKMAYPTNCDFASDISDSKVSSLCETSHHTDTSNDSNQGLTIPPKPPAPIQCCSVCVSDSCTTNIPTNTLSITIQDFTYEALIDTGAELNFISMKVLHTLDKDFKGRFVPKLRHCKCANQSTAVITGDITLPIVFQGQTFWVPFACITNTSYPVFLGMPFLQNANAVWDFKTRTLTICPPSQVTLEQAVHIQPHSEAVLSALVSHAVPANTIGLCSPMHSNLHHDFMVANSVVQVQDSHVPIRVFNPADSVLSL